MSDKKIKLELVDDIKTNAQSAGKAEFHLETRSGKDRRKGRERREDIRFENDRRSGKERRKGEEDVWANNYLE